MISDWIFFFKVLVFSIGLVALPLRWIYRKTSPFYTAIDKIPGPKPLPIVGNALGLLGGFDRNLAVMQIEWPAKYGDIYRFFAGSVCNVCVSSPELIETVLSDHTLMEKGTDYDLFRCLLGDGLVNSIGDKWKQRRRLLAPAFHLKVLENFLPLFNEQSLVLCHQIEQRMEAAHGKMDVYPLFVHCTLDIICGAAMGTMVNAQTQGSDYLHAIVRVLQILMEEMRKPWLAIGCIFRLTPLGREKKALLETIHGFINDVISQRRQYLNQLKQKGETLQYGEGKRQPLLDLLLQVADDGAALTQEGIKEEISTFMFGGHNTTATAMSWFLYSMADNPQYQNRVFAELDDIFGTSERHCTFDDLSQMKYLDCCIKETLRLYPSTGMIERKINKPYQLGQYLIPAGCNLSIMIYGTHRNPRIYTNPSVYNPDRFLASAVADRHPYAYIPFSVGPRNCIGQKFATIEMKLILSTLMRRFKFQLSSQLPRPVPSFEGVVKSLNGFNLVVSKR